MRLLRFAILFIILSMNFTNLFSKKPDFAFPQTVAKTASKDLNSAIKHDDAHAALNALIRLYVSDLLIDYQAAPKFITKLEATTDNFKDTDLAGIFYALQATAYNNIYKSNRWIFDERELPLTPRPKDITEWSGEMFKAKIADLCRLSVANPTALSSCPIKDYKDIIEASTLTVFFYPTLLDFACSHAADLVEGDDKTSYIQLGEKYSPQTLLWQTQALAYGTENDAAKLAKLKALYLANCDNEHSPIVLKNYYRLIHSLGYAEEIIDMDAPKADDNDQEKEILSRKKWLLQAIGQFLTKFPNSLFQEELKGIQNEIIQKSANINIPKFVAPGKEFEINLTSVNAKKVDIKLYKIPGADAEKYRNPDNTIYDEKPYKTISMEFADEIPFQQKHTIKLTLEEHGYYAIFPTLPEAKGSKRYLNMLLCIDKMPAVFTRSSDNYAVVVEPVTGAPLPAQQVVVKYDKEYYNAPLTNAEGITNITETITKTKYHNGTLFLKDGKDLYTFDNMGVYLARHNEEDLDAHTNITAQILTDRAIYRPGDKIQFLAIVSSLTTKYEHKPEKKLYANRKFCAVLNDANNQTVGTIEGTTDDWGRFSGEFTVPQDGLTGYFSILVSRPKEMLETWGYCNVMVSEYKMPDFELVDLNVAKDTPSAGCITITGKASMYSGMPLANAHISLILSSCSYWRWYSNNEKIWSTETQTDAEGNFSIEVAANVLSNNSEGWFVAQIDATSPTGTSAGDSKVFTLGKPYGISIEAPNGNVNGQLPLKPSVNVIGPDGNPASIALKWEIRQNKATVASGQFDDADIDISNITPGNYEFWVLPVDSLLADPASSGFYIFNRSTDIVPGTTPIWLESESAYVGEENVANISYGVKDNAYIYYALASGDNIYELKSIKADKGYHDLQITIPADVTDGKLYLLTIQNFKSTIKTITIRRGENSPLQIVAESFRDKLVPQSNETWRFNVIDANGKPVEAAFAIDMYNKALEALRMHSFYINFPLGHQYTYLDLNAPTTYSLDNECIESKPRYGALALQAPTFYFYDQFGFSSGIGYRTLSRHAVEKDMICYEAVGSYAAPASDSAIQECRTVNDLSDTLIESEADKSTQQAIADGEEDAINPQEEKFDYREASMPLALWVPMLTTDADGKISYSFQVPNAVTTWRLRCIAWSQAMEVGNMLRDLVAAKPVMAQANAPRFLRAGDKAIISALVMNNSDTADTISTTIQLFNPFSGEIIKEERLSAHVGAMQSTTVDIETYADGSLSSIGYRIRSTMGNFTDGEQTTVPILPSLALLIETEPFYLNPGDTNYTTTLPSAEDARISLTFSENPMWSIVSALPGLRTQISEYANSAAAALFSAALSQGLLIDNPNIALAIKEWSKNPSDSALVSMLEKNEDLKIALLNATPWVESAMSDTDRMARLANIFDSKEIESTIDKAINILADLQLSDGGWAWGKWCDESSEWVTSNVLEMMGDLKQANWLPDNKTLNNMIEKALKYYDKQVSTLRNGQKKLYPNLLYSLLRPLFPETAISEGGQKVIKITLNDIESNWKKYNDPAYKSMAAIALYRNGRTDKSRLLMMSVSEFGVRTPSQGIIFPNVNSLTSYAIILEAFATIDPNSQYVDGLRQQLIVRKQGTDWGSAVVTSQVVVGILSCGTKWTVPAQGATVMAGNHLIAPTTAIEKYTGTFKANLSPYGGEQLHITTPGVGPAYGAVYAQFKQTMETIEPHACEDLFIDKQMTVRRGTQWEMLPDTLQVGDRVKIQLTIHCKRNLDYVTIIDERAACYEPVDQIPGWLWSEGVSFYRENRDSSTNLFVINMRPGTYLLTYEMNVSQAGVFSSGVATIQSQYAPEISAHSQGCRLASAQNK